MLTDWHHTAFCRPKKKKKNVFKIIFFLRKWSINDFGFKIKSKLALLLQLYLQKVVTVPEGVSISQFCSKQAYQLDCIQC